MTVGYFAPKLKSTSHTLQEARETRIMILGANTLLDARQNLASPANHMLSPRDIRTREAGATIQPAESGHHDLSGGHSTGIETMSTDTDTGNLRQRAIDLYPIAINPALTGTRAYLLGIDLAMPLPPGFLASPLLAAPATSPTITQIRIVHHSLYSTLLQPIFIMAAPEVGYIRIYDVVVAIHRAMAPTLRSLPGTKFVGLAYDVALSNRLLRTQDKYQDRTWILMTHDQFVVVST
jgi:hypothetical protein